MAVETNKSDVDMSNNKLNFGSLVSVIEQTHQHFQQQAVNAVNVSLTVRNWLVGYYLVTFEQKGEGRAVYGSKLLSNLAESSKISKDLMSVLLETSGCFISCIRTCKPI